MILATDVPARIENVLSLLGVCVVFILILAAAYYTSRLLGKTNLLQPYNRNISILETFRLGQNKFIQIVKIGEKYIALAVTKDHVEMLTELREEELHILTEEEKQMNSGMMNFKDVFAKVSDKVKEKNKKQRK